MPDRPDQKYLRVRNTSDSQVQLSDLEDEENSQQNKGVQVYIDAGEYVDLPMDGDVLHSYEQGTIKGFMEDGKVSASPYEAGSNELWVGPNGDDDNPGTRNSPLGSIQTAIDQLDEEYGIPAPKEVRLKPGTYKENILMNAPNLRISGEQPTRSNAGGGAYPVIEPEDESRPICTITNMSSTGFEEYMANGGIDFNWTAPDSYSYTGASLNVDLRDDLKVIYDYVIYMFTGLERVVLRSPNSPTSAGAEGLACLGAPIPDHDQVHLRGLYLNDSIITTQGGVGSFCKNTAGRVSFSGCKYNSDMAVFDTGWVNIQHGTRSIPNMYESASSTIFSGDSSADPDEGGIGYNPILSDYAKEAYTGDVYIVDSCGLSPGQQSKPFRLQGSKFSFHSDGEIGGPETPRDIHCKTFDGSGTGNSWIGKLECVSGQYSGTGTLDIQDLKQTDSSQSMNIQNGSNHTINSGTVRGDLVFEGGSTSTLKNFSIEGDLIIRDSGTQVDAEGCHVQGAVQIESTVDTTQNFYGGSIIGSGHTNKIRNENGNDVSGSANWNRVGGGGGSNLTTTEEAFLDAVTHGQQVEEIPLDIGTRPSSGFTLASWNNDLAAINFDYEDGGTAPSAESDNGKWYMSTSTPSGYTGGNVIVRCHYSLISSGSTGDSAEFKLDFGQHSQGADLTSLDPGYTNSYNNVIDLENISYDTIQTFDFTIPESDWSPTESQTFFNLERMLYKNGSDNTNDTFQEAVYVHAFYILYEGYGLKPNPSAP